MSVVSPARAAQLGQYSVQMNCHVYRTRRRNEIVQEEEQEDAKRMNDVAERRDREHRADAVELIN